MIATFLDGRTADIHTVTLEMRKTDVIIRSSAGELARWTLNRLRERPLGQDRSRLTLGLDDFGPARLTLADPDQADRLRAACPNLHVRPPLSNPLRYVAWTAIALFAVIFSTTVLLSSLSRNLADAMPLEYELSIADIPFDNWLAELETSTGTPLRICDDPAGMAAIDKLMAPILAQTDLPYPVTFHVTDYPGANAGAFPGGRILIYEGVFAVANEPRLFAALMAHEIGHIHYRHMIATSLRTAALNGLPDLLFGPIPGGDMVSDFLRKLNAAEFSREMETEADAYAHEVLLAAGMSPLDLADYFANSKLRALDQIGILSYLNSHPFHEDRIHAAEAAATRPATDNTRLLSPAEWDALTAMCDAGKPDT